MKADNQPKNMHRKTITKVVVYSTLVLFAALFIIPFLWLVSTSLKGTEQIFAIPPKWIPEQLHWENYSLVFERMPFLTYFRNSVLVTVLSIVGVVASSSLVAYAFAHLRWPGRDKLFIFVIVTMMLPLQVTMIPVFVIFKNLGWLNTFKPLIVPAFLAGGLSTYFSCGNFSLRSPRS